MVGIYPGGFPCGDVVSGKVHPRRVGPSPELGKGKDTIGSGVALHEIREKLEIRVTGYVGWLFLTALESVIKERDSLYC